MQAEKEAVARRGAQRLGRAAALSSNYLRGAHLLLAENKGRLVGRRSSRGVGCTLCGQIPDGLRPRPGSRPRPRPRPGAGGRGSGSRIRLRLIGLSSEPDQKYRFFIKKKGRREKANEVREREKWETKHRQPGDGTCLCPRLVRPHVQARHGQQVVVPEKSEMRRMKSWSRGGTAKASLRPGEWSKQARR